MFLIRKRDESPYFQHFGLGAFFWQVREIVSTVRDINSWLSRQSQSHHIKFCRKIKFSISPKRQETSAEQFLDVQIIQNKHDSCSEFCTVSVPTEDHCRVCYHETSESAVMRFQSLLSWEFLSWDFRVCCKEALEFYCHETSESAVMRLQSLLS